jgi:anti-sigma-K factor RskA
MTGLGSSGIGEHREIEELLGAYALDAVEADVAAQIEIHLRGCPRCRAEVNAHREVATLLGNAGADAPDGLWDRIVSSLEEEAPPFDLAVLSARRGAGEGSVDSRISGLDLGPARREANRRWQVVAPLSIAVAAAAVAIVILGVRVANLDSKVHTLSSALAGEGQNAEVAAAVLNPSHVTIPLMSIVPSSVNRARQRVDLLAVPERAPTWTVYWTPSNLATLPKSDTYQLWALVDGRPESLGVLGPDPRTVWSFQLQPGMKELMVTVEPVGGSPSPTTTVVVEGKLPPAL